MRGNVTASVMEGVRETEVESLRAQLFAAQCERTNALNEVKRLRLALERANEATFAAGCPAPGDDNAV